MSSHSALLRQHYDVAKLGNQHFMIEPIQLEYIALDNQNRALDSLELGTRQLLEFNRVIALWIRRDRGPIWGV